MDEKRALSLACAHLGLKVKDVIAHKLYKDRIVFVMEQGHKHKVPLADFKEPEKKRVKVSAPPRKRTARVKKEARP